MIARNSDLTDHYSELVDLTATGLRSIIPLQEAVKRSVPPAGRSATHPKV